MSKIAITNVDLFNGLHYFKNQAVVIEDSKIDSIVDMDKFVKGEDTNIIEFSSDYVLSPGLIDTHIHGIHGFGTDQISKDSIIEMSKALPKYGVTSFCPTVYPNRKDLFKDVVKYIADAKEITDKTKQSSNILGAHLEGPFMSLAKKGVHKAEYILPISVELIDECYKLSKGNITNITVAVELEGIDKLIKYANEKGILLQMGHSDASTQETLNAIKLGVKHATHLFNAMSPFGHRDPGMAGVILSIPTMHFEAICDTKHYHPIYMQTLKRTRDVDKIIMITDALTPTGQSMCPFIANGDEVVLQDKLFIKKSDMKTIAGSTLTLNEGVKNLIEYGDYVIWEALTTASTNVANLFKLKNKGYIALGYDADLVIFNKKDFKTKLTMVNGNIVYKD